MGPGRSLTQASRKENLYSFTSGTGEETAAADQPQGTGHAIKTQTTLTHYCYCPLRLHLYTTLLTNEQPVHTIQGVEVADDCDFDKLAEMGEGYSGDDITNVCREAAMNGLRRIIHGKDISQIKELDQGSIQEPVRMQDFLQAYEKVRPSVGRDEISKHERWRDEYGST